MPEIARDITEAYTIVLVILHAGLGNSASHANHEIHSSHEVQVKQGIQVMKIMKAMHVAYTICIF